MASTQPRVMGAKVPATPPSSSFRAFLEEWGWGQGFLQEGPRRHCSCPPLGSDIPTDTHFQNNMPGLLAEAPELSKSHVMRWALLLDPGKLDGLVTPCRRVLAEQVATRHGSSTLGSGLEAPTRRPQGKLPSFSLLTGTLCTTSAYAGKAGPSDSSVG